MSIFQLKNSIPNIIPGQQLYIEFDYYDYFNNQLQGDHLDIMMSIDNHPMSIPSHLFNMTLLGTINVPVIQGQAIFDDLMIALSKHSIILDQVSANITFKTNCC